MTGHLKEGLLVMAEAAGRAASEVDTYQVFRLQALAYRPACSRKDYCRSALVYRMAYHHTDEACVAAYHMAVEVAEAHSNYPRRVPPEASALLSFLSSYQAAFAPPESSSF